MSNVMLVSGDYHTSPCASRAFTLSAERKLPRTGARSHALGACPSKTGLYITYATRADGVDRGGRGSRVTLAQFPGPLALAESMIRHSGFVQQGSVVALVGPPKVTSSG